MGESSFHSVELIKDKCVGCTLCVRHCPTEAIRVRDKKAHIIGERCIDCGMCIRVCPSHAKKPLVDKFEDFEGKFKWYVALPAPAIFGQFPKVKNIDYILTAFKKIGFDDVFEVSRAAEIVSDYTRQLFAKGELKRPVISTACPAVVRLIRVRFPDLCDNLLKVRAPIEVAEQAARAYAVEKTGYKPEEIGVFFISPCPAKMTACRAPIGDTNSHMDGVLAISDLFVKLQNAIKKIDEPEALGQSGLLGIGWANSGGEASALLKETYLGADGIENCIKVLDEVENYRLSDVDFIELNSCTGGCVGGVLAVENPFIAKTRISTLRKYLPVTQNKYDADRNKDMYYKGSLAPTEVAALNTDRKTALSMLKAIDELYDRLEHIDCCACGSPSCRAFAEDVVKGMAKETDCIFIMRDRLMDKCSEFIDKEEILIVDDK